MRRSASRRLEPAYNEPLLSRAQRRARGIYYTPPEIVRQVVRLTLGSKLTRRASEGVAPRTIRILDPACGAGVMLVEAHVQLGGDRRLELCGIDTDPSAIAAAQAVLPAARLLHGDALFDARLDCLAPFDVIVGNPPYINIRQLAKSLPAEEVLRLRDRYSTARGNFDLYVPFIERCLELLSPGGRCGLVIPNKWATLDYAQPLRTLLLARTSIEHVVDLSSVRVFAQASVYPHILIFAKKPPAKSHAVVYQVGPRQTSTPQRQLSPAAISFVPSIDVESRVPTRPLGELAVVSCGTPGYSAQRVAAALRNATEGVPYSASVVGFITSGNIDRFAIRLGNVRFLGRTYERPILPLDAPGLTERQRRLFSAKKIVVAGLSQRLEAASDDRGLALGVQVFALSEFQLDPQYLLALLNSKLLSYLFRTRFAAKRLAGGYMAINKGQLARLPIVIPREGARSLWRKTVIHDGQRLPAKDSRPPDADIDERVYRLYRLTKAEIATVEEHFAHLGRRAA